jgi:hypothetical protein
MFIESWADDDAVKLTGLHDEITRRLPEHAFEVLDLLGLLTLIKNRHLRAMQTRQTRGTQPAASCTEDGELLRGEFHDVWQRTEGEKLRVQSA